MEMKASFKKDLIFISVVYFSKNYKYILGKQILDNIFMLIYTCKSGFI